MIKKALYFCFLKTDRLTQLLKLQLLSYTIYKIEYSILTVSAASPDLQR